MMTDRNQRIRDEANEILDRNPAVETFDEAWKIAERGFTTVIHDCPNCGGHDE